MNKVSMKVFISTFFVIFIAMAVPNLIDFLVEREFSRNGEPSTFKMAIVFIVVLLILILIFNYFMSKIVLDRIKVLNNATKDIIEGNYDVFVEDKHNDEISDAVSNFNIMVEELKSNEYLNKEFIRNFSHELKTPLAAIKGYADLIIDSETTKEEQFEYASIISNESDRLSELSKNLLLISYVDSQVILPKQDSFDVSTQMRSVIQLTQLSWEEKELNLELDLDKIKIDSNKELLYQVWMNLFSNAVKFSNDKGYITIELNRVNDKLVLKMSNEGSLEESELEKVFELFFVSNKSRTQQSSGVGLTLTKKIVEKLDGEINLSSEKGLISFIVELPI